MFLKYSPWQAFTDVYLHTGQLPSPTWGTLLVAYSYLTSPRDRPSSVSTVGNRKCLTMSNLTPWYSCWWATSVTWMYEERSPRWKQRPWLRSSTWWVILKSRQRTTLMLAWLFRLWPRGSTISSRNAESPFETDGMVLLLEHLSSLSLPRQRNLVVSAAEDGFWQKA